MRKSRLILLSILVFCLVALASEVSLSFYHAKQVDMELEVEMPVVAEIGYWYNKLSMILLESLRPIVGPTHSIWDFKCMAMVQFLIVAASVSTLMLTLFGIQMHWRTQGRPLVVHPHP